jgi:pimeloyl-ACP methyl ester carboxylesterase
VPLDRSGIVPGALTLSVERKLAGIAPSRAAVLALAGGPGQAALPLSAFVAQAIAPALSSRDLLLFDQRGTGASNPLSCSALEGFPVGSLSHVYEQCALQIGPQRGDFTTQESVLDIEALRQAGGYEKLVLYGTSYGTKVALDYAARYPQNVEALVLDSAVPAAGEEPLDIPTFKAIAPALEELCANRACAGITANPLHDVAHLAALLRKHALSGSVYDGSGRRHASTLTQTSLLGIIQAGDLNPALRALLPSAVRSALRHDPDPLLRLQLLAEGLIPNGLLAHVAAERPQELDEALFATTLCEETAFPWQRAASRTTRLAEAIAFAHARPVGDFYPFDAVTALQSGLTSSCAGWPDASAAPPAAGTMPNVPTLILSGEQDLRTPTSTALLVASLIPDAQMVLVPFTGHSVIGSDLTHCASRAVSAFFAGALVQPCGPTSNRFAPTPLTPTRLAGVRPPAALPGRAGQTLVAVLDALVDLNHQIIGATLQANRELPSGARFGGLRGGYARLTPHSVLLHDFSFVPGVQLTGTFRVRSGALQPSTLHISGAQAAAGTVRTGSGIARISGTLGGRRFSVSPAKVTLSSSGSHGWPSRAAIRELLANGAARAGGRPAGSPQLP